MQELAGGQLRGGITSEKGFANSMGQPKEDAHQQHLGAALLHARPPLALNFLMLSAPALTNVCSMGWAARARTLCGAGAAGRCSAVMPSVQAGDAHVAGTDDRASASPGPSRHTPAPHPPPLRAFLWYVSVACVVPLRRSHSRIVVSWLPVMT